jgi:hypothetical protein
MPPRAAVLRWPNGATSTGHLVVTDGDRPIFLAGEVSGPLAQRGEKQGGIAALRSGPGFIDVKVSSTSHDGRLAHVEPRLLDAVPGIHPNHLDDLAEVAGSGRGALSTNDDILLSKVIRGVLRHMEAACSDGFAMRQAIEALERPYVQLDMVPLDGSRDYRCKALLCEHADEVPDAMGEMLHGLDLGAHLLVRAKMGPAGGSRHMMGINVTRLSADWVQVNLINSNTWQKMVTRPEFERAPAVGKPLPLSVASAGLTSLQVDVVQCPQAFRSDRGRGVWDAPSSGAPLAAWLRALGPATVLQPAGHRTTPQKGEDCVVEMELAWLTTVLPQAEYKLAKAHILNVLRQTAEVNKLDQDVVQRLDERITSSLSAHAMAIGRDA